MGLSKRERVIRTLELEEPDMIPIHYLGFETTGISYQYFKNSDEYKKIRAGIENEVLKLKFNVLTGITGSITELRFWNSDIHSLDPWGTNKFRLNVTKAPPEYPECIIFTYDGRIFKSVRQIGTGLMYFWYEDGYFRTPEIVHEYWDKYGKPIDLINNKLNYSPQIWEKFVKKLSKYLYPMATLPITLHESLFEGMTISRATYYMRKNPQFIHEVMTEFNKVNLEIIKRLAEAGVDIVFYMDDLGMKQRSIFSIEQFKEFILPYYKQMFQACKKNGMFVLQHSCGYIDKLLPHMVDAGLNGIQALEPAAGVNLAHLKETLGDKVAFIGGIDGSNILNFGTPKDVEEEVKRCIKAAAQGGGYFAGPSHNVLNAPWDNILALRAAIEKYRKYPLNLD
ncbi:MAG: uroporphyrinogen decarboxylase family protein [Promethearchaeota archaeon]|jgi:uroporphyrinogen-III decarboxylase